MNQTDQPFRRIRLESTWFACPSCPAVGWMTGQHSFREEPGAFLILLGTLH
jgi:hypothetical protein